MSELTTQLEQARQEITEKEAESRALEERVAGLSQQLREASSKLEVRLGLGGSGPAFLLDLVIMYCRMSLSYRSKLRMNSLLD